jgi:hypothetical protein
MGEAPSSRDATRTLGRGHACVRATRRPPRAPSALASSVLFFFFFATAALPYSRMSQEYVGAALTLAKAVEQRCCCCSAGIVAAASRHRPHCELCRRLQVKRECGTGASAAQAPANFYQRSRQCKPCNATVWRSARPYACLCCFRTGGKTGRAPWLWLPAASIRLEHPSS